MTNVRRLLYPSPSNSVNGFLRSRIIKYLNERLGSDPVRETWWCTFKYRLCHPKELPKFSYFLFPFNQEEGVDKENNRVDKNNKQSELEG